VPNIIFKDNILFNIVNPDTFHVDRNVYGFFKINIGAFKIALKFKSGSFVPFPTILETTFNDDAHLFPLTNKLPSCVEFPFPSIFN
jgi:hypothetical protein